MKNVKRFIVIKYPLYEYDLDEVQEIYHGLQKRLQQIDSTCDLLAIPHDWEFMELNKEQLLQIRDFIDMVLERKENDIDSETGTGPKDRS